MKLVEDCLDVTMKTLVMGDGSNANTIPSALSSDLNDLYKQSNVALVFDGK